MKHQFYNRKLRQLKQASTELNFLLKNRTKARLEIKSLVLKIKLLIRELRTVFSSRYLKRTLAGATFVLGICFGNQVAAQSFSPAVHNPFNIQEIDSIAYLTTNAIADFDNDGDYDIISGGSFYDRSQFNYLQNTGTPAAPNFADPVGYPFGIDTLLAFYTYPTAVDIDADGDFDLVSGSLFGGFIAFNMNTGTMSVPNFSTPADSNAFNLDLSSLTNNDLYNLVPAFADIDNDGDKDLFIGGYSGDVFYFENTGTASSPSFGPIQTNPFNLSNLGYFPFLSLSDLDGDGDKDLLSGIAYGTNFSYYENTGTAIAPSFAAAVTDPFGLDQLGGNMAVSIPSNMVDLDGDGDKDLLTGFYSYGVNYYQNTSGIGAGLEETIPSFDLKTYPSPTTDIIHLDLSGDVSEFSSIEVLDLSGKICLSFDALVSEISLKNLESGFYTLRISDKSGKKIQVKVQKI